MTESFEQILTGGHPNSLGRTLEVVDSVLNDKSKLEELYNCYFSKDEVVRLRVSNAMKRVCIEHPEWTYEYADRLINEISKINQESTQWTLAILFRLMTKLLTKTQREETLKIMKNNLDNHNDWIVINTTMETLFEWSKTDESLKSWLVPRLEKFKNSDKKSIAGRAKKYLSYFSK